MSDRRQFLSLSGAFVLSSLITGCRSSGNTALQIKILKGSISPQLLAAFRRAYPDSLQLNLQPVEQLGELFEGLTAMVQSSPTTIKKYLPWQGANQTTPEDLVTLGHGWLPQAIAANLIQPMALAQLERWANLPEPWRSLVQQGNTEQLWGIPYRCGTTLILYRKDKLKPLGWVPQDWADFWRQDIGDRLSLLNHSREGIGLVLKKMGYSYNETDLSRIQGLETELKTLHQNVKFYSSTNYLQPLINGDTWLAQAWSHDALPLLKRYANLGAVVPQSGTALWCDLWVQPRLNKRNFQDLQPWLNFCGEPAAANQFALSSYGTSPLMYDLPDIDPKIKQNPLIWLAPEIRQQSEIIQHLDPPIEASYQALWRQIRTA